MELNEYRKFTTKSEINKTVCTLRGILLGINIDWKINDSELAELRYWCRSNDEVLGREPFCELLRVVEAAIETGSFNEDFLEDVLWLCNKFEYENLYYNNTTRDLQLLQGICHGILADGIITDDEVKYLQEWMDKRTHLFGYYPYDEIHSLITGILADGTVEEHERKLLTAYLSEFATLSDNVRAKIQDDVDDVTVQGICSVNPVVEFDSKTFCFTGESGRVKRSEFAGIVEAVGSTFSGGMTQKVNYLIIGDNGNPCWTYSCYGRKVEKALELRKKGHNVVLLHEADFWSSYDELSRQ